MAQMEGIKAVKDEGAVIGEPKNPLQDGFEQNLRGEMPFPPDLRPPEGFLNLGPSSPAHPVEPGHLKDGDVNLIYNKAKFFAGRS